MFKKIGLMLLIYGPIVLLIYLVYRAIWVLTCLAFYKIPASNKDFYSCAGYTPKALLHEMGTSGALGPVQNNWVESDTPAKEHPTFIGYWRGFAYGLHKFYLIPWILVAPGFYKGLSGEGHEPYQVWPHESN